MQPYVVQPYVECRWNPVQPYVPLQVVPAGIFLWALSLLWFYKITMGLLKANPEPDDGDDAWPCPTPGP